MRPRLRVRLGVFLRHKRTSLPRWAPIGGRIFLSLSTWSNSTAHGWPHCDTVDDVRACLQAFRDLQAKHGIEGISSKISHGCSEYGQKYPAFKFPETDDAPEFVPDPQWSAIEKAYFRSIKLPAQARESNTREHVSLRDVFAFCTWVKYAELIGDPSSKAYAALRGPDLSQQFTKRVRSQAKIRRREMEELQKTE